MDCRCTPMPLDQFPPEKRREIEAAVEQSKPPPRLKLLGTGGPGPLASIPSRAWMEWHRARGRCPRCKPTRSGVAEHLRDAVLARDGMVCGICGDAIASRLELHIDHIHPVAHGGRDALDNLQPSHAFCNMRKGAQVV